jgi:hypothetical protein
MAKNKPTGSNNKLDLEKASYRIDDSDNSVEQAVCDLTTHNKLDELILAINNISIGGNVIDGGDAFSTFENILDGGDASGS